MLRPSAVSQPSFPPWRIHIFFFWWLWEENVLDVWGMVDDCKDFAFYWRYAPKEHTLSNSLEVCAATLESIAGLENKMTRQ